MNRNIVCSILQRLQQSGKWRQRCNAFGGQLASQSGPTDFCVNASLLYTQEREVNSGPFLLLNNSSVPNTVPLFQCWYQHWNNGAANQSAGVSVDGPTFLSLDRACEHQGVLRGKVPLGLVSTAPNSLTPRTLHRCCTVAIENRVHSAASGRIHNANCEHVLDAECESDEESKLMGYVV